MFQLIVAVISIALVVILSIAAIYFGGSAFTDSKQRAIYAQNVNSASQIDGALQLYYNDNVRMPNSKDAALLQELKTLGYLKDIPQGDWTVSAEQLYKPIDNLEQCIVMNKLAGKVASSVSNASTDPAHCPPCSEANYKTFPGCMMAN